MQELEKILEEIEEGAHTFEILGRDVDFVAIDWVRDVIRKRLNDAEYPYITEKDIEADPPASKEFLAECREVAKKYGKDDGWIPLAIRDLQYLVEEYSTYPPETGVNATIGSLQYCISALKEIQQYREIGTVEECREAVEKQKAKKPLGGADINGNEYMICRECSAIVEDGEWRARYCPDCGQAIRWDENDETDTGAAEY